MELDRAKYRKLSNQPDEIHGVCNLQGPVCTRCTLTGRIATLTRVIWVESWPRGDTGRSHESVKESTHTVFWQCLCHVKKCEGCEGWNSINKILKKPHHKTINNVIFFPQQSKEDIANYEWNWFSEINIKWCILLSFICMFVKIMIWTSGFQSFE